MTSRSTKRNKTLLSSQPAAKVAKQAESLLCVEQEMRQALSSTIKQWPFRARIVRGLSGGEEKYEHGMLPNIKGNKKHRGKIK